MSEKMESMQEDEMEFETEAAEGGFADIISDLRSQMLKAGTCVSGDLTASDAAAGVFSWQNTTGHNVVVSRAYLWVTTASTGAATVDVGRAATAVSADNLMDGLDVNAATGLFSNLSSPGTNGKTAQAVAKNEFVTASRASGATAGLKGRYVLELQYLD